MSDASFDLITRRLRYLEFLALNSCFKITDQAFSQAALIVIDVAGETLKAAAAAAPASTRASSEPLLPLPLQRLETLDIGHTGASSTSIMLLGAPDAAVSPCIDAEPYARFSSV